MYRNQDLAKKIIGAFFQVYNELGHGYLEKVYERALAHEVAAAGMPVRAQEPLLVRYKGMVVGEYFADLVVDGKVIVELKAAKSLATEHQAQLLNYLKGTGMRTGLLLNFGPKPEIKRLVV